ncbi:tetratricopeptide repeat protein [Oryzibacter oryziterrae]|uniref:tetratricopeptide repeat-containing glycosyltransferase family protein n=1 Tax=Oryzibacter oryziterrae TaxID=2766474 RepID=UPI001F4773C7|nr:tetratricopeptide repeat-containing glycosyltransferase family protein [Oryzibacter oryziterrae]
MSQLSVVASLIERGFAAHNAHKFVDAIALYEVALAREPGNVSALNLCASAYRSNGDLNKALQLLDRAVALEPQRSDVRFNQGNALTAAARYSEAIAAYAIARAGEPGNAEIVANIGVAHGKAGDYKAAIAAYEAALAIDPGHRTARHNYGNALAEEGRFAEAMAVLRSLAEAEQDFAEARYNLSLLLLRMGDYGNGFAEYEWRWKATGFPAQPRHTEIADWDGRPFPGKTLLLHAEQGLGDSLQFLRFAAMVKSLGGDVVLQVPRPLVRLARTVSGVDRVVSEDKDIGPVDLQTPLLGLPHRLHLTLGSVGMPSPYLAAEPALVSRWRERLQLGNDGRKAIGFVWRGNPKSPADRGRSLSGAGDLRPFARLDNVRLIALQKLGADEIEKADTPSGWKVAGLPFTLEYPGPEFDAGLDGFVDTAAVMQAVDLVVSVCTAPLHLAGALGRPAIGLIKAVPDWRWLLGRADSPWYPSIRLCRQREAGLFAPVIDEATREASRRLFHRDYV